MAPAAPPGRPAGRPTSAAVKAVLVLVATLFLASTLATLRELDARTANQTWAFRSGSWFTQEAMAQLQRLQSMTADYALPGRGGTEKAAIEEQFEVFWSRVPVLGSDEAAPYLRRLYPVDGLVAALLGDLERVEPLLAALAPGDAAGHRALNAAFADAAGRLRDFALQVHLRRIETLSEGAAVDARIFWRIVASIVGMVGALAAVAVLLLRETGRTRRLLREAGAARAEATGISRRLQTVVDAVPAMITASDPQARYLIMNRFHAEFYGLDAAASVGRTPGELGLDPAYADEVRRVAATGAALPFFEQEAVDRDGRRRTLLTTKVPVADEGGGVGSVVHVSLDVTERRAAEERVRHMAHHDPLTDLPNRVLFRERLRLALAAARRNGGEVAVLCLDLDRFKAVNDTLGHAAGDALLVAAAARMRACLRGEDTLARLGGDEFAVVQERLRDPREAGRAAERIVRALARPFLLHGGEVVIGASGGISVAPGDGTDADDLLRHADMALYRAKNEGRGRVAFFTAEMNTTLLARRALEADLRRAVATGEGLHLHYQPKHGLRDRRLVGLEALARWSHPEHGEVPPGRFVPLAEETGLIGPLGERVLLAACRQGRRWLDAGLAVPPVAVNLSPAQFSHGDVAELVERCLAETGLPPGLLELEITESVLIRNYEQALAAIRRLRAGGVQVSLDDFGTGYSSLGYLQRFPLDLLKIDRSFVAELGRGRAGLAIVEAIVRVAHGTGLRVVAEGVETAEQLALLRDIGCDAGQGYLFAPPLPASASEALLRALLAGPSPEAAVA